MPEGNADSPRKGTLWLVATPIGTAGDLSPRAREVLAEADLVLAEDTRRLRSLLRHLGLSAGGKILSFNEHNEDRRLPAALERLAAGGSVALVSDAGTPVLSDPGFPLVRAARSEGYEVLSVPGPSSFVAALAASGQPPLPATLAGFLPPRKAARRRALEALREAPGTVLMLVSPHRIRQELADAAEVLGGERPATLLAEISKFHERGVMETLAELARHPETENPRGEYILVVGPAEEQAVEAAPEEVRRLYDQAISDGLSRPEALRRVARRLSLPRREIYDLLEKASD